MNYLVLDIRPEWVVQPEEMGGKEKFWYRSERDDPSEWLFKFPRPNSGEHWAEKIAAEVAQCLEISCAPVKLAVFQGTKGSVSESFIRHDQELFPGNQILARHVSEYHPSRRFRQNHHTLENIWLALEHAFEETEGADSAKARFAEFLVLDAVIGNTDRHHENWGVVRRRTADGWIGYIAPSFDHASSLGRELMDKRRDGLMANNRIDNYSDKGFGGIYWSESDVNSPTPLALARLASVKYPEQLGPALAKVPRLNDEALSEIVDRVPIDWMTDTARRFAKRLMSYNCLRLKELT